MKRGFTIIELLVASLLLAMLVTILTMIFNQSSIAWRTGTKGVDDLGKVRSNIADIRDVADNLVRSDGDNGNLYLLTSLWDDVNGSLRKRAVNVPGSEATGESMLPQVNRGGLTRENFPTAMNDSDVSKPKLERLGVGAGNSAGGITTYTIGVWSYGPDGQPDTYDDITSWPEQWE